MYEDRRSYLVSNDTKSAILKFNKCEAYLQKITTLLTNERHVLVDCYFCTYVSCFLDFDMDDMVSFNTKYTFFVR